MHIIRISRKQMIDNVVASLTEAIKEECTHGVYPTNLVDSLKYILVVLSKLDNTEAIRRLFIEGYTMMMMNNADRKYLDFAAESGDHVIVYMYEDTSTDFKDENLFGVVVNKDLNW